MKLTRKQKINFKYLQSIVKLLIDVQPDLNNRIVEKNLEPGKTQLNFIEKIIGNMPIEAIPSFIYFNIHDKVLHENQPTAKQADVKITIEP